MCTRLANLFMLLTWGPHMVYHGDPIYILYLYDQMWLVGLSCDAVSDGSNPAKYCYIVVLFIIQYRCGVVPEPRSQLSK